MDYMVALFLSTVKYVGREVFEMSALNFGKILKVQSSYIEKVQRSDGLQATLFELLHRKRIFKMNGSCEYCVLFTIWFARK